MGGDCFFCKIVEDQGVLFVKNGNRGVFFVKKVENGGCFFVKLKWTFPQRRMHYVQYHYFLNFTFILLIWGVRTHPPCLRAYIFSAQIGIFDGRFSINCVSFTYFIRFRYLDHLDANRMAPTVCPDPIERNNVVGFKQFCTPYFRRIFGTCL